MIAVPYLSVFGVGYLIYRGVKKNEAYRAALGGSIAADSSNHVPHNSPPAPSEPAS